MREGKLQIVRFTRAVLRGLVVENLIQSILRILAVQGCIRKTIRVSILFPPHMPELYFDIHNVQLENSGIKMPEHIRVCDGKASAVPVTIFPPFANLVRHALDQICRVGFDDHSPESC